MPDTRRRSAISFATALVAASAGVAVAAIPGADGTITTCYERNTVTTPKTLRVIDDTAEKCASYENELDFNQTGATGPTGPRGETGAAGRDGGDAVRIFTDDFVWPRSPWYGGTFRYDGAITRFDTEAANAVQVTAGTYVVTARAKTDLRAMACRANGSGNCDGRFDFRGGFPVECQLRTGDGRIIDQETSPAGISDVASTSSISTLAGAVTVDRAMTIIFACQARRPIGYVDHRPEGLVAQSPTFVADHLHLVAVRLSAPKPLDVSTAQLRDVVAAGLSTRKVAPPRVAPSVNLSRLATDVAALKRRARHR